MIFFHSGLFAPPPQIFVRLMSIPSDFATSKESLSANATPSKTACVISALVVSIVMPINVPLAFGLLCGERSPIRYGKKYTWFSPSFVISACSFANSFVWRISSIHHLLHDAALNMQPIRWYVPSACANAWSALLLSTRKFLEEMKIVPLVPREMLHLPSPTVPVPTAAAALSPAPAATATWSVRPSSFARSSLTQPTFS